MASFRRALSFLSVFPIHVPSPEPGDWRRAALWFPVVGLILGAILAAAFWCLSHVFSSLLAALLTVACWAFLTGGLHLDGLADCGDGLAASVAPEARLEIMRDPRLGAFGVLSLVLFLVAKISTLASLSPSSIALLSLLLAPALARWSMLWVARLPPAQKNGMGASFAADLSWSTIGASAPLPLALAVLGGWRGLAGVGLSVLAAGLIGRIARSRLGGITGDVLGLSVEVVELTTLMAFVAGWA
jgi:adenosylcobinamide-GDP ribazoletransferase